MATYTHAVVNPATGAVTTPGTYNQTVVAAPTEPSTTSKFDIDFNAPMIRELVVSGTVMEPQLSQELTAASSFFTGDQLIKSRELLNNLKFGQENQTHHRERPKPTFIVQQESRFLQRRRHLSRHARSRL